MIASKKKQQLMVTPGLYTSTHMGGVNEKPHKDMMKTFFYYNTWYMQCQEVEFCTGWLTLRTLRHTHTRRKIGSWKMQGYSYLWSTVQAV